MTPMRALVLWLACAPVTIGLDNGLSVTPPRGWRSWNAFGCDGGPETILNDPHLRAQMRALLDKSRTVDGKPTSLAELGFNYVSMDDGWQSCNCSGRKDPNASEPQCPQEHGCFNGGCSFHDPATGMPLIKPDRFPDMKNMIDYGHSLGLKVGSYLNNCICMEAARSPTHYVEDVKWLTGLGFDEVKIDSCGTSKNVSHYSELFNASGWPVRVENCHNGWPDFKTGFCPMNFFRSGGDIAAGIGSILGEAHSTVYAADLPETRSRPGCWAYPDMSEVGNFKPGPSQLDEERTHWSLWCIVSSPLILGFDMNNTAKMDRAWPIVTNREALAVSEAWAGHPGTMIRTYDASLDAGLQAVTGECDGSKGTLGWEFKDGNLVAPNPADDPEQQCINDPREVFCPPPTTYHSEHECGQVISKCNFKRKSNWTYNGSEVRLTAPGQHKDACLYAMPLNFDNTKGYFVRQAASVKLMDCPHTPPERRVARKSRPARPDPVAEARETYWLQATPEQASFTRTSKGELRTKSGRCLKASPISGVELWAKRVSNTSTAILLVNSLERPQNLTMPLADVPKRFNGATQPMTDFTCVSGSCTVTDIWTKEEVPISSNSISVALQPYASAFYMLRSHAADTGNVVISI